MKPRAVSAFVAALVFACADASAQRTYTVTIENLQFEPQTFARSEMRALLERKIDALPDVFRTVFVLRCVEEMSVDETARCLDIPEATVRSRHFRARSMLRESLAQEIDRAESDVFEFGGLHCDRIAIGALRSRYDTDQLSALKAGASS